LSHKKEIMATIKRSELNELKRACADNREDADYYFAQWQAAVKEAKKFDAEAAMWCRLTVQFMNKTADLKDKLWAAEQEVSDLKKYAERCDWLRFQAEEKFQSLEQQINAPFAQIDPPSCLKPKDALEYQYQVVTTYSPEPNSGPY